MVVVGSVVLLHTVTGQAATGQNVTTLKLPRRHFVKNAHTQCNKNPTEGLVVVTM
jgi:hypothetical protein